MKREKYIDHTILKPDARREDVLKVCEEAKRCDFASVCVNPVWTSFVARQLAGSDVKTCVVVGFPLGALTPEMKAAQTTAVIEAGAQEVDMVINIGAAKDDDWETVQKDIEAVTHAAKGRALVKVIIEACLLTDEEKKSACLAAKAAGADFVKTSTGFSTGGASAEDVALMRAAVGPEMGVKAAGGIRTKEDMDRMIAAGADRIGTSAGVRLV